MKSFPAYFDRRDMSPCSTLHIRPEGALVGDMSFYSNEDECHLFYLSKRNDDPPRLPRCEIDHAVSRDLLHWEQLPPALVPGERGEPDGDGLGGSTIVHKGGKYHMFFAGADPEVTYHAESDDLIEWKKDEPLKPVIVPDPRWYVPCTGPPSESCPKSDWRDPWIIRDEPKGRYVMTVTAGVNQGPPEERGSVGWAVSDDLEHWEIKPPLYAPGIGRGLEVTELFEMDGRYYLIFSHGETIRTVYRVADRLEGPYRRPSDDLLIGNYMYAPRTAVMGPNRYLVPWAADRTGGKDDYQPEWGSGGYAWGGTSDDE